ncbi:hypothetical protein GCM10028791_32400 [Echinicola sediminis]
MEYFILKIAPYFCFVLGNLLLFPTTLSAQIPTGTPRTDEPALTFNTTADIILYLALPLLVIVLGVFWWFFYKKPKIEKEKEKRQG